MKAKINKSVSKKTNKINKLIAQQQTKFNIPSGTIKDGIDNLPTVQDVL
jgi:hypothetical protein